MSSGTYKNTPNFRFPGEKQGYRAIPINPMPAAPADIQRGRILDEPPERSEEEKQKRQKRIDNCIPIKSGAFLIRRHRSSSRTDGGLWKASQTRDLENIKKVTGTVLKVPIDYRKEHLEGDTIPEEVVKPGDWIYFSEYAPFSAFQDFPEIQLIHASDIIMKFKELPEDTLDE